MAANRSLTGRERVGTRYPTHLRRGEAYNLLNRKLHSKPAKHSLTGRERVAVSSERTEARRGHRSLVAHGGPYTDTGQLVHYR